MNCLGVGDSVKDEDEMSEMKTASFGEDAVVATSKDLTTRIYVTT